MFYDFIRCWVNFYVIWSEKGFTGYSTGNRNSPEVNRRIQILCESFQDCDITTPVATQIGSLQTVDFVNLVEVNTNNSFGWEPLPFDGTFYPTDAIEKYKANNLPSNIPIATGTKSYDGSDLIAYGNYLGPFEWVSNSHNLSFS